MRGRCSKRKKRAVVKFEMDMLFNLQEIYEKLKNREYKIKSYNSFTISEPKVREIQTLKYVDRVVQHVVCDEYLMPYFSKHAITDNCVCQPGKGMHFALARLEKQLHNFIHKNGLDGWVLKCDIKKYFPSMPHENLKKVICSHIADKDFCKSGAPCASP